MPEQQILVYERATGAAVPMHSVDAAEAVAQGDYTYDPPPGESPAPEPRAAASASPKTPGAAAKT